MSEPIVAVNVPTHFTDGDKEIDGGTHQVAPEVAERWAAMGKAEILSPATEGSSAPAVADALPHEDFRPGIWNKGDVPAWVKEAKTSIKAAAKEAEKRGDAPTPDNSIAVPTETVSEAAEAPAPNTAKTNKEAKS